MLNKCTFLILKLILLIYKIIIKFSNKLKTSNRKYHNVLIIFILFFFVAKIEAQKKSAAVGRKVKGELKRMELQLREAGLI